MNEKEQSSVTTKQTSFSDARSSVTTKQTSIQVWEDQVEEREAALLQGFMLCCFTSVSLLHVVNGCIGPATIRRLFCNYELPIHLRHKLYGWILVSAVVVGFVTQWRISHDVPNGSWDPEVARTRAEFRARRAFFHGILYALVTLVVSVMTDILCLYLLPSFFLSAP